MSFLDPMLSLVFNGDSKARNSFSSLLCFVLTEKAMRKLSKQSRDDEETGESSADEDDLLVINDEDDDDDELVRGSPMHVEVKVVEAYDLPPALCNYVFCQYKFWNDDNTIVVPPINASISNPGPKTNTMIFEHKQVGLNIARI